LKLFLNSEELGDYISKNINDINTNKKHLKYDSTINYTKKSMYNGIYKNNKFSIKEVLYAPNIQNNLIFTHYLCKKGFKLVMEMGNNKEGLQIFRYNKLIITIYINDENLFILNTSPMKNKDNNLNNNNLILD